MVRAWIAPTVAAIALAVAVCSYWHVTHVDYPEPNISAVRVHEDGTITIEWDWGGRRTLTHFYDVDPAQFGRARRDTIVTLTEFSAESLMTARIRVGMAP